MQNLTKQATSLTPRSPAPRKPRNSATARGSAADSGKPPARGGLQREQLEYYLGHLAQYDVLTELPNRSQFHDRLSGAMARATRHHQMVGIMLLNVDCFKAVNIKHGHSRGDLVLKRVAGCLKQCTRKSDTLARTGGDEFAVILEDLAPIPVS